MSLSSSPEEPSPKSPPGRGLLFAGVAAAALMGVGLGLWARPAMSERQMAAPLVIEAAKSTPTRMLQIVVEDAPAVFGAPIEVLPATRARPQAAPPPEQREPELVAPVRPRSGLVRVQSVESEPVEAAPPPKAMRRPEPKLAPQKAAAPKAVKIKAAPAPKAKPPRLEKVKVEKTEKAKVEKVKAVERAKPKPVVSKVAKAAPKPVKAAVRLAKVDRPQKPARVEKAVVKRPAKLSPVVVRIAQHKPAATPKPQKVRLEAKLETKKPKAIRPPVKVAQQAKPVKAAPAPALRPARGAGPVRLAKAQPRPDTAIRDADLQMNRAYSSARAAGVPDWQLRKQQARWEAARASAAREAPWAVHDVYLARIAELHDLTKDAQASGY